MAEEKSKYTAEDLAEFKAVIEHKLEEARYDLNLLNNELSHKDSPGTDDTSRSFNVMEDGASTFAKEMNAQKAQRQAKFIKGLENALLRIQNNTYGVCRVTGKLIRKERLMLVPHATLSIEAKNMQS